MAALCETFVDLTETSFLNLLNTQVTSKTEICTYRKELLILFSVQTLTGSTPMETSKLVFGALLAPFYWFA